MKFWDTIAKMCGVEVDVREWGVPVAGVAPGGFATWPTCRNVANVDAWGHRLHVKATDRTFQATLDGHGFRLVETEKAVAINSAHRIGLIAIERIRPMKANEAESALRTNSGPVWTYDSSPGAIEAGKVLGADRCPHICPATKERRASGNSVEVARRPN